MTGAVLDSSALLALINEEPGASVVAETLSDALISAVNYAEVITKLIERGVEPDLARAAVVKIGVRVIDFDMALADMTAALRQPTRHRGLSLADRACLALALREGAPAVTADRVWAALDIGVEVRLIR